ncbi:MAG: hypothetical protein AB7D92_08690 [Sphaerochaeta sp.]
MDRHAYKGRFPFFAGFVLLLLLLFTSCSHTQQEQSEALLYSPTYEELEKTPLSIPETAHGYGREYELLGVETFTTTKRGPYPGFVLREGGTFPSEVDDFWIVGRSNGEQEYLPYYSTDPSKIQFTHGGLYEVRFHYKVLESPDKGFEVLFFSNTGASLNDWVNESLYITDKEGSEGDASLTARLRHYTDYELVMNVVSKGAIAVRDIVITDLSNSQVVAEEHGDAVRHDHSLVIRGEGDFTIEKSTINDEGFSIVTQGFTRIWNNVKVLPLPKDTIILLEFDYKVLDNPNNREHLGWVRLVRESDTAMDRGALNIPAYGIQEGHYTGAVKTGLRDEPYILEMAFHGDVSVELTNIALSRQIPVQTQPAIPKLEAIFPRLGDLFNPYGEWFIFNNDGTPPEGPEKMSLFDLERKLAYNDILVGVHEMSSTNDPAFALRMRRLNPSILLLPSVPTHEFWDGDEGMQSQFSNELANAEISFIRDILPDWLLKNTKGLPLGYQDGPHPAVLNVSPFCPTNSDRQTYLDYWKETVMDLHVTDGTWDGLYLNQLFDRGHYIIKEIPLKRHVNADYNLNGKKDESPVWVHEMTAAASMTMLRDLRTSLGMESLIIASPLIDPMIAQFCNGITIPQFNRAWYFVEKKEERFAEAQWCHMLNRIWSLQQTLLDPDIIMLEATPKDYAENKRIPNEDDLQYQRFALGSALLTDAFYEYDLVNSGSIPYYFDETLVTKDGKSTDDIAGKGWLGKALGEAEHLSTDAELVYSMEEPVTLGDRRTKYVDLFKEKNKNTEPMQYCFDFDWKILETSPTLPAININLDGTWEDYYPTSSHFGGTTGHMRFHITIDPKQLLICTLNIGREGVVEISNGTISKANCGVFRRDFEHGIVVVNATNEDKIISLKDIKGPLNRTNPRRIKGVLDTVTNNGQRIMGDVTIKAHDALILLAD